MNDDLYAQMLPNSSYILDRKTPTFGEYAQVWLNSRAIVDETRDNYKSILNQVWMPPFAARRIDEINSADVRKIIASHSFSSLRVRRNAQDILSSVLATAVMDGWMDRNPCKASPARSSQSALLTRSNGTKRNA